MKYTLTALLLTMAVLLCSCTAMPPLQDTTPTTTVTTTPSQTAATVTPTDVTEILLADHGTTVQGEGVSINGNTVTVTKVGTYTVKGALSDGQLRVETADNGTVTLILDGVSVHSNKTAPLFVRKGKTVVLTLADGSQNTFADSPNAVYEDAENEEPSAAVFSKADLIINGGGALIVNAAFNDGIVSRDGLTIDNGNIVVNAADDAVMGRDYVRIGGGELTLTAAGDGIKSTNDASEDVGSVIVQGGKLTITSGKDGIQAKSSLAISGGEIAVTANGGAQNGSANSEYDFGWGMNSTDSSSEGKGLKAGTVLTLAGGTVQIDAADDAIHSNRAIVMSGGDVTAAAGDDGLHADEELTIDNGTLRVTQSYEGLEAATISLNGGEIAVVASDDGVNASSGSEETSGDRGMNRNPFMSDDSAFYIRGGHVYIDAKGDGLDSNGIVEMSGGEVYVVGPSGNGNGTFDYGSAFEITGGKLVAIGSSGMATTPTSNTMNNIVWSGFSMNCDDVLRVTAADGTVIAELAALRSASWMYITCSALVTGEDVTVSCGTDSKTFTIQEGGNAEGSMGGMFGGGFGGGPGMGGGRPDRPW